ncbi:MAG TPA: PD-(D/E)XK nuclease family protein [Thermoanaerobaculales bacterium]|nr:PD-(D/E)XK nuclease family protein [Thermoanaerobaculales bacterium]
MATLSPTPRHQYSFSRVKTFAQCPLRYRFRYVEGRREAFRSIETYLGSTLHAVVEWLYERRDRAEGPALPAALEELARRWGAGWTEDVAVVRAADSADGALRLGREMLSLFHRSTFARDRSETIALEARLTMQLAPDIQFTGVADRIGRIPGGRLFIVDYKTSRSPGTPDEFSEGLQAQLYAGCAIRLHDEAEALAGYHYLRSGRTSWHLVSRTRADGHLHRFGELARAARDAAEFPARPSVLCAWCGLNAICPEARVPAELSGGLRLAADRGWPPLGTAARPQDG